MFTIAIPIYKYKKDLAGVFKSIDKLDKNLITTVVAYIEPTEDTEKIVSCLSLLKAPPEIVINPFRLGMVENFNQCILKCKTPWLIINHDDDFLLPGILNAYRDVFMKHPKTALISSEFLWGGLKPNIRDLKKLKSNLTKRLEIRKRPGYRLYTRETCSEYLRDVNVPGCSTIAFNFGVLQNRHQYLFDKRFKYSPDEELWPRILKSHAHVHINKCLVKRNLDHQKGNYEYATWEKNDFFEQYFTIRKEIWEYSRKDPRVKELLNDYMGVTVDYIFRNVRNPSITQTEAMELYDRIMENGGRKIG